MLFFLKSHKGKITTISKFFNRSKYFNDLVFQKLKSILHGRKLTYVSLKYNLTSLCIFLDIPSNTS